MTTLRFGIATDLHIALPHTVPQTTHRFHRTEHSIATFEAALSKFAECDLDVLLLSGDLTQHGEIDNHAWLSHRLSQLPYPVYVIPGNHDIITTQGSDTTVSADAFRHYYGAYGYADADQLYYTRVIAPQVRLVGLNSVFFQGEEQTYAGRLDDAQLRWLVEVLEASENELVMVMVHHNVVEHLPGQAKSHLGQRYMLQNAPELLDILSRYGVQLIFTGHLHVQDVAQASYPQPIYDIATGSTVSYPHPFRIMEYHETASGVGQLQIESHRVRQIPGIDCLQEESREFMADRSYPFIERLLTDDPLGLDEATASKLLPELRYFWADIARGDAEFHFPHFEPAVRQYFEQFSCKAPMDNATTLQLTHPIETPLVFLP
ncbi:MAG: metallophosphoesterase [Elainellaceae cyanobacterium]